MTGHAVAIAGAGPACLMLVGALASVDVAIVEWRTRQDLPGSRAKVFTHAPSRCCGRPQSVGSRERTDDLVRAASRHTLPRAGTRAGIYGLRHAGVTRKLLLQLPCLLSCATQGFRRLHLQSTPCRNEARHGADGDHDE